MLAFIKEMRKHTHIGFVGGSDLTKIREQLGQDCVGEFDYAFSQNGLVASRGDVELGVNSIQRHLGDQVLNKFISEVLRLVAALDIPLKRGTFVEFRSGMLNISPIGRNCSQQERLDFYEYDKIHNIRSTVIASLRASFPDLELTYSIGGQISFDVFPTGWDKTYCLQFLHKAGFKEIHFFGDKTYEGGNDHEIFESKDTIGHTVVSPEDTMAQVSALLGL